MYHFSKELSPHEQPGVLSVLMYFNIHIANIWQSNIDSEIKQTRSIHPGLRQTLFFLLRVHLEQLACKNTFPITIINAQTTLSK